MLYIIRDLLFPDIELSPGEELKQIGNNRLYNIRIIYIYLYFRIFFLIIYKKNAKFCLINLL